MKPLLLFLSIITIGANTFAQRRNDNVSSSLKKENIFVGGSIALGYTGGTNANSFVIGANPEIGYTLTESVDIGFSFNAIFNSYKFYDAPFRYRQNAFNYGAGIFTRIHVLPNFFIQAQPEYNWIVYKQSNLDNGINYPKITTKASSFLAGIGYGQRVVGQSSFFTVLMFDLATERFSPYRDTYGTAVPIIRGGFNIYLNSKKRK
jgi:hypothetical protein